MHLGTVEISTPNENSPRTDIYITPVQQSRFDLLRLNIHCRDLGILHIVCEEYNPDLKTWKPLLHETPYVVRDLGTPSMAEVDTDENGPVIPLLYLGLYVAVLCDSTHNLCVQITHPDLCFLHCPPQGNMNPEQSLKFKSLQLFPEMGWNIFGFGGDAGGVPFGDGVEVIPLGDEPDEPDP